MYLTLHMKLIGLYAAVMKKVKGVVQILGHGNIPGVAKGDDDLVRWYRQVRTNLLNSLSSSYDSCSTLW